VTRAAALALVVAGCGRPTGVSKPIGNSVPPADVTIAIGRDYQSLTLARIAPDSVHVLGEVDQVDSFAWIDARVVQTIEVGDDRWRGSGTRIAVSSHGEVYLTRCTTPDPVDGCPGSEFLRVWPRIGTLTKTAPPDLAQRRTRWAFASPYEDVPIPPPPTVSAPADVSLAVIEQLVTVNGNEFKQQGASCTRGAVHTFFPDGQTSEHMDPEFVEHATVRWVQLEPPIYEVLAELSGPELSGPSPFYFRPCEAKPLDGYVWLDNGRWGSFVNEDGAGAGTWTFWHRDHKLGTLRGTSALLSNL
jgi:hypothetical protein